MPNWTRNARRRLEANHRRVSLPRASRVPLNRELPDYQIGKKRIMKNATKYAEELNRLHKRLLRDGKPPARPALEPLDALVRGAMSYDVSDSRAEDAMKC